MSAKRAAVIAIAQAIQNSPESSYYGSDTKLLVTEFLELYNEKNTYRHMGDDDLTALRTKALELAVNFRWSNETNQILDVAKVFENYILKGN